MGAVIGTCYLSMPSSGSFREIGTLIANAIKEAGYAPVRLEDMAAVGRSVADVTQQNLQGANVVVADLTGANPNIIYEVGFAHALRKPVLLLAQDLESTPAALLQYLILKYDPQEPAKLRTAILGWFARATARGASR